MAPNALSFHLSHLSRVGLIEGRRESRFIHYSANFAAMGDLVGFLTENCCQGRSCLPAQDPAPAGRRPRRATSATSAPAGPDAAECECLPATVTSLSSRRNPRS